MTRIFHAWRPTEPCTHHGHMHDTDWLGRIETKLASQLRFLIEADRLKSIVRRNRIADGSRRENTAEHSWHLSLFALVLGEWAAVSIDLERVLKMLILHDLVEIEADDTPLYLSGSTQQHDRERIAAEKLFGLLPSGQGDSLRSVWEEFEAGISKDARFAKAIDRLQPLLLNHAAGGGTWVEFNMNEVQERQLTSHIERGAPELWRVAEEIFRDAVREGWLRPRSHR